jgi:hypothetical protein
VSILYRRSEIRRTESQRYCGRQECQRARKKNWSRQTYAKDEDYRENQKASTAQWLESQGSAAEYYRDYRRRKRKALLEADSVRGEGSGKPSREGDTPAVTSLFAPTESTQDESANRDATSLKPLINTGRYRISPADANRDAYLVEIRLISCI